MEKYIVKGSKKDIFFGEYKKFNAEVSKEKLTALLKDPKVIIDEVRRKSSEISVEDMMLYDIVDDK